MQINPLDPEMRARAVGWLSHRLVRPAAALASGWRATLGRHTTVIAVTGSFGKTTTTRAIAAILDQTTAREDVSNSYSRLYIQLFRQTGSRRICVLEIGVGRPNQMRRYAHVFRPQIAVVTSVGLEHEAYFPDQLDGIQREKGELVAALRPDGVAVLNADDPRVLAMAERTAARIVTFGSNPSADVALVHFEPDARGSRLTLRVAGKQHELRTQLIGAPAAKSLLGAVAAAYAAGLDIPRALEKLAALTSTPRRLERVALPNGVTALLDDYKNTPPTAHAAFDVLAQLPAPRRIAVLGNIPETTGGPKELIYQALGAHAARVFDRVYIVCLTDERAGVYRQALIDGGLEADCAVCVRDVYEAAAALRQHLQPNDVLLIKGHFFDKLSRIVLLLRGEPVQCPKTACMIRGSAWCDRCPACFRKVTQHPS